MRPRHCLTSTSRGKGFSHCTSQRPNQKPRRELNPRLGLTKRTQLLPHMAVKCFLCFEPYNGLIIIVPDPGHDPWTDSRAGLMAVPHTDLSNTQRQNGKKTSDLIVTNSPRDRSKNRSTPGVVNKLATVFWILCLLYLPTTVLVSLGTGITSVYSDPSHAIEKIYHISTYHSIVFLT